jgi:hypothetical protein
LKRLLTEVGCEFDRQGKGDHELWYSPITNRKFVVDNNIKSRHTANAVLKQAGLPRSFQQIVIERRSSRDTESPSSAAAAPPFRCYHRRTHATDGVMP